jgi:hypothetical protein
MTPIHPSQIGRCREKRTVLLVGEGLMEWAFLRHVVQTFHNRCGPVAARPDNAHGGSPETVIQTARKLLRQRAFDVCVILMDTDVQWPASRPSHIGRTRVEYLAAAPCLEGLLLRIAGHLGITTSSTVDDCKRTLYDNYVDWKHRTESKAYAKAFSKDLLLRRRGAVAQLDALLKELE